MPFTFDGKPPALLGSKPSSTTSGDSEVRTPGYVFGQVSSSSPFNSFSPPSGLGHAGNASSSAALPTFGTTPAFGKTESPWAVLPSQEREIKATGATTDDVPAKGADTKHGDEHDFLGRALVRAATGRQAGFGADRGADAVMEGYLKQRGDSDDKDGLKVLRQQLTLVRSTYPELNGFTKYIFEQAAMRPNTSSPKAEILQQRTPTVQDHQQTSAPEEITATDLSYFIPKSRKPQDVVPQTWSQPTEVDSRPCCERRPETTSDTYINSHLYLTKAEQQALEVWLLARLKRERGVTNENAKILTTTLMEILESNDQEKTVKQRCENEMEEILGDGTWDMAHALFESLYWKHYMPSRSPETQDGQGRREPTEEDTAAAKVLSKWQAELKKKPFRFMDLAPELRNRIYREAMVPGVVRLKMCRHHQPHGVAPAPNAALSATCKQVRHECKDLLFENTFIADAVIANTNTRMFHPQQIPVTILPQLTSLVIVFYFEKANDNWRLLRSLKSLKHLTICGIQRVKYGGQEWDHWWAVLKEVLEGVPADCEISFGPRTAEQNQHVWSSMEELGKHEAVEDVDGAILETMRKQVEEEVVRGSKCGDCGPAPLKGIAASG